MKYDAIIIGAGAGGGVVAGLLAEAGKRILLLERGRALTFDEVGRDHLRNQRLPQYGCNAGPSEDAGPRVVVSPAGHTAVVTPLDGRYQNNAACVGSGTRVYGAQAWRFLPDDFRMATRYGVPQGSSLADWPITYEDLAPYYERAEWEMGVAGDAESDCMFRPQHRAYPMPPLPLNAQGRMLRLGASVLGWDTQRVPLLINSAPYNGRPSCVHCQQCVGFACPTDAKNGTQNTVIARALATSLCTLETEAMVEHIDTDIAGRVVGVTYWDRSGERVSERCDIVVCSAGAIETPRLLLNSHSSRHPEGLGNPFHQVGRHLQGHCYAGAIGWMTDPIWDGIGPGATTATLQFNHGNEGLVGGGMLADDFIEQPINFVKRPISGVPTWGLAHKQWVRHNYTRMLRVCGPVQEIPNPDSRVRIDPSVCDRWGIPVARLSGTIHPETKRVYEFLSARAEEWLQASGASEIVRNEMSELALSAGQHQAGTCRMGHDPKTSVTDAWGRVHGHENLFVADGSLHVTNGGLNPVLTILALAYRVADGILGDETSPRTSALIARAAATGSDAAVMGRPITR